MSDEYAACPWRPLDGPRSDRKTRRAVCQVLLDRRPRFAWRPLAGSPGPAASSASLRMHAMACLEAAGRLAWRSDTTGERGRRPRWPAVMVAVAMLVEMVQ